MRWTDYLDSQEAREQDADSRETSIEIMRAIVELTESPAEADQLWNDGYLGSVTGTVTDDEVIALAWKFTRTEEDTLYWGETTIERE